MKKTAILGILAVLALAASAQAALLNHSFEEPNIPADTYQLTTPTGWGAAAYIKNGTMATAEYISIPDGQQLIETSSTMWQNTGIALVNGTTYTLTFYAQGAGAVNAKGWLAAADNTTAQGTAFETVNTTIGQDVWTFCTVSATYTGVAGKYLSVNMAPTTAGGGAAWGGFDKVSVIPEPGAMAVLALGGIGMIIRRRRRA